MRLQLLWSRELQRQGRRWAEQKAQEQPPQPIAPPQAQAAAPGESTIDQLKELGQLKEQGVLTEEEFAAQKAKILSA
ncbi:MAG: SHOCT domain-containing protein [Solirubrobacterales bacterium]